MPLTSVHLPTGTVAVEVGVAAQPMGYWSDTAVEPHETALIEYPDPSNLTQSPIGALKGLAISPGGPPPTFVHAESLK